MSIPLSDGSKVLLSTLIVALPVKVELPVSRVADFIFPVEVTLFNPSILDCEFNTTAFSALAWPGTTDESLLISIPLDVTRVFPNCNPAEFPLCDNTLRTVLLFSVPTLISPVWLCVTTLPSDVWPKTRLSSVWRLCLLIVAFPMTKLPPITTSLRASTLVAFIFPVVLMLFVPISISAESLIIEPLDNVISPNLEPEPVVIIPCVEMLFVPIFIVEESLTIEPSDIVISPSFEPLAEVIVPVDVILPVTLRLPVLTFPVVVSSVSWNDNVLFWAVIKLFPNDKLPISALVERFAESALRLVVVISPVVTKLLFTKSILSVDAVILSPWTFTFEISAEPATVREEDELIVPTLISPNVEFPAFNVPVVVRLFWPKVISALPDTIEPSDIVISPNLEPEEATIFEVKTIPSALILPKVLILLLPIFMVGLCDTNWPCPIVKSLIVEVSVASIAPNFMGM